jgi:hypothetical protein
MVDFANPLVAEVARIAKQRQAEAGAAQNTDGATAAHSQQRSKASWRDDEDAQDDSGPEDGQRKRKHAPIVWSDQPKVPKVEQRGARRTAAEIAQAEVEEFRRVQAQANTSEGQEGEGGALPATYMKDSPDVSSPEEEMHIRREGNSPHNLHDSAAESPAVGPAARSSRWGGPVEGEAGGEGTDVEGPSQPGQADATVEEYGYPEVPDTDEEREEERNQGEYPEAGEGREDLDAPPVKRQISMLKECRSVDNYEKLNRISEGTYGVVYR